MVTSLVQSGGLVDVAAGLPVTVSGGSLPGGGPTFRGSDSYWVAAAGQVLTLDLGYVLNFIEAIAFSSYFWGDGRFIPAGYSIAYSTDGTNYTTAVTVTHNTTTPVHHAVNITSARYIQVTVTALQPGYSYADIAGLQVLSSQGTAGGGSSPWSRAGNGNNDNTFLALTGNVGIGTTSPTAALHLGGGQIKIGSTVIADGLGSYYA